MHVGKKIRQDGLPSLSRYNKIAAIGANQVQSFGGMA